MSFLKSIYIKLFRINDSPHKIALGFGIGVFLGVFPGTGPIASLCAALLLRLNRASSLLGSLLVNTWTNIITFLLAVKIGSVIMGQNWQEVYNQTGAILKNFSLSNLFKLSFIDIILPVLIGYFIIGICAGVISYIIILIILRMKKTLLLLLCIMISGCAIFQGVKGVTGNERELLKKQIAEGQERLAKKDKEIQVEFLSKPRYTPGV